MRLPADSAASSTPPSAAEPRAAAKAGTGDLHDPDRRAEGREHAEHRAHPRCAERAQPADLVRRAAPAARAGVIVNATDAPAPSAAAASTATCGELTATIAATSAGAVTTATSKTIDTIA